MALGTNRVVLGPRPEVTAEEGWCGKAEMVDMEEEEATCEEEDVTMKETATKTDRNGNRDLNLSPSYQ